MELGRVQGQYIHWRLENVSYLVLAIGKRVSYLVLFLLFKYHHLYYVDLQ